MDDTYYLKDTAQDILSHPGRRNRIHILTLDHILATDVYERIHHDPRMKNFQHSADLLFQRPDSTAYRELARMPPQN